jgi:hypothetical protein
MDIGERAELHGYGQAGYTRTRGPDLQNERPDTENFQELWFLGTYGLSDRSKVWIQVGYTGERRKALFDWAFVDYQFSGDTTGRFGQIKLPFGLVNEVRDIAYLHLSAQLPLVYDDRLELITESFRGVSVEHTLPLGTAGELIAEGYGGRGPVGFSGAGNIDRAKLYGGRIAYKPLAEGFDFGYSLYFREGGDEGTAGPANPNAATLRLRTDALSASFRRSQLKIEAEAARSVFRGGATITTGYLQAGYLLAERWRPYARIERLVSDRDRASDPSFSERVTVAGVGFIVNSNISLRLEYARHFGYAVAVFVGEVAEGAGRDRWNAATLSLNYIF